MIYRKSTAVVAEAASKRQKAEKESPPQQQEPEAVVAPERQQLLTLKQRFNALHELRFTEPENQLEQLQCKTEEMRSAHAQHIAALEQAHSATLVNMQHAHDLELKSALEDAAKHKQQPQPSETKAIAILDCFKTLTGMHVDVVDIDGEEEEVVRGTCTIFNPRTKRGVKFKVEFTGGDKVKLSPGANCKKLLTEELVGPHVLDKCEVPLFICAVQTHLFN